MPPAYEDMSKAELIEALRALQADPRLQSTGREAEQLIHDLQVHQIELEMQNRELREAQLSLEESRRRYADLYDFAPVVYLTLDRDGRIQSANLTAAALFRAERGALIGRSLTSLVAIESQSALRGHLEQCFAEQTQVVSELTFSVSGREMIVAQMMSAPILDPGRNVTGCKTALTDISALKRSEEKLRFLARASAVLASSFDYAANLAEVVRLAVPLLADICFIDVLEDGGRLHRVEAAFAAPRTRELVDAVRSLAPPADGRAPQAQVLRSGQPILLPECTTAELRGALGTGLEHEALLNVCNARSLMFVPLAARGRTLGVATFVMAESARYYAAADLVLAEDLAARAAMAIDGAQLYQEARRAVQARESILSIVSHDLKSPLGSIMLAAIALSQASPQLEARSTQARLEVIRRSAEQMDRIINDLLDMSSIDSGRLSIEPGEHDIEALIGDAVEILLPLATQKGLALEVQAVTSRLRVLCDRERMLQVFSNLIGNAIKFTPAGGSVTIGAELHQQHQALITIQDTGPGIAEPLVPRLFERHWQARETARQGRGLGLYIAKSIVEAQGGTIWVNSRPGAGTTFYFTIPLAPSTTEGAQLGR